ncbi:MAG: DUF4445 domain-containing protein [Acidobacteria bacterium]|nr:DUF4445 domain-containing protein [Acidobacteriota bacterium]
MPRHVTIEPKPGQTLSDQLFDLGVEFPCGGGSLCGGCRVRLVAGDVPVTEAMREALSDRELAVGWRLACLAQASAPVTLEVEQWSPRILTDDSRLTPESRHGLGVAIDLGTTTLVAELVDLHTGEVLGVRTALNPQGRHGADVMSRIEFDLRQPGALTSLIRRALGEMVASLASGAPLAEVLLCGNTVMHHLFCGESVEPLSHVPFHSPALEARTFTAAELGWPAPIDEGVTVLPCLGGFVGSDLLCGLLACGVHTAVAPTALLDLGTNGEIAVAHQGRILCASTAAGPAFEGGRIRMGMRAGDGAIDKIEVVDDALHCHVIGGCAPRGICGSGLVDAAAVALETGAVAPSGRLTDGQRTFPLTGPVELIQADFRELQLAKGAIAAGFDLLTSRAGLEPASLPAIHLAGAFGNYVRTASARRIGLLPCPSATVHPSGNSAVRGARGLLLSPSRRQEQLNTILSATEHIELGSDRDFQESFIEQMAFPDIAPLA